VQASLRVCRISRNGLIGVVCLLLLSLPQVQAETGAVQISVQPSGKYYRLVGCNDGVAPMNVRVDLASSRNLRSDVGMVLEALLRPGTETTLAHLEPLRRTESMQVQWQVSSQLGDPDAVHDAGAHYLLPFPAGRRLQVAQAADGPLVTHNSENMRHAIDIAMPVGTPIRAARSGRMLDSRGWFGEGRPDGDYLDRVNFVRILHPDGTWAMYAHLSTINPDLRPGDWVEAGTQIGLSGSSGFSSGPHLHFAVLKNTGSTERALPFQFYTLRHGMFVPHRGEWLQE
jgi:murein DD-endopeptidase MepM/ murein hydrolase activator NlpD